jgi:uncharacterized protein YyaL (SSP411 family)
MNRLFVNIKVDREERPDVDHIYMEAVQLLTRRGGWPMTVFLTPDGRPYPWRHLLSAGGPPRPAGLPTVLRPADAYHEQREAVLEQAGQIMQQLGAAVPLGSGDGLDLAALDTATEALIDQMDGQRGGLKGAPKFPQPMLLEFLLRQWRRTGDETARALVDLTLDQMARGGIYDQIGGGFARYSTDAEWLVPHFEKMLYDNAQLARLYLDAYRAFGTPAYRRVVEETLDYVVREMTSPEGGFYSAQDADSEGAEGKFYVWTPELVAVPPGAGRDRRRCLRCHRDGNLRAGDPPPSRTDRDRRAHNDWPVPVIEAALAAARPLLYAARAQRVWPDRDDKVLTGWNGLMLRALAEAGRALDRLDYIEIARRNADFILRVLRRPDGRLWRTAKDGVAHITGYLEDHAAFAGGLLALYEATFEERYFAAARDVAEIFVITPT